MTWVPRTYHYLTDKRYGRGFVWIVLPLVSLTLTQIVLPWIKAIGQ